MADVVMNLLVLRMVELLVSSLGLVVLLLLGRSLVLLLGLGSGLLRWLLGHMHLVHGVLLVAKVLLVVMVRRESRLVLH